MVYVCFVFDWRIVLLKRDIPLKAPIVSVYLDYPLPEWQQYTLIPLINNNN